MPGVMSLLSPPYAQMAKYPLSSAWAILSPTVPTDFDNPKVPTNFQLPESVPAGLLIDTFSTNENSCPQVTEAHGMAPPRAGTA